MWGILEKFKAANALTTHDLIDILEISKGKSKIKYNKESCIFRNTTFNFSFDKYNKISYSLDIFEQLGILIDKRLRFCPSCIKQGYHSIHHQLTFFEKCLIHNEKLEYLCDCKESFIIQSIGSDNAYCCNSCKKEINILDLQELIMNIWKSPIKMMLRDNQNCSKQDKKGCSKDIFKSHIMFLLKSKHMWLYFC